MMAQHFVDMDEYKHNQSLLITDAINTCLGICAFYDGGVFSVHASPTFGLPTSSVTTAKVIVQQVNFPLLTNVLLDSHHFFFQKFLRNVAAASYEHIVDIGCVRAVCIVGGKNETLYQNINTFIKELQSERENITIIENPIEGTIAEVKFYLTSKHLEEFLGAIIYSNAQANIVVS